MKKVIVTGGLGFIGSNMVDLLVNEGYEVHVVDNLSTGKMENSNPESFIHFFDIAHDNINGLFQEIQPQFVFHFAARPRISFAHENPEEAHAANVTGTLRVLQASKLSGAKKVVYSSSSSIYGRYQLPADEFHTQPNPVSMYGWQKYAGETYCKMFHDLYGMRIVALRYFNVYGPRMTTDSYGTVIGKFIEQTKRGEPMTIDGSGFQSRDFTWVGDVVNANLLAAKSSVQWGTFNIGSGKDTQIIQVAKAIGSSIQKQPARKNDVQFTQANIRWAKEGLGWEPAVTFAQGIKMLLSANGITRRVYAKRQARRREV
jgi:UDP-glucose 4-epimerase